MRIFSTKELLTTFFYVPILFSCHLKALARIFSRLACHCPVQIRPTRQRWTEIQPRVWSSPRTRYGNASVDARARFPSLSTGKPVEMPEMRKQKYHCDVSTACARGVSMITECFQIYKSARALPRSHYQFCGSPQLKSFSRSPNKTDAQQ